MHCIAEQLRRIPRMRIVTLALWLFFIWGHSLLPGEASSSESGFFVELLGPIFRAIGVSDIDTIHLIVRKGAHFSEYAVLGVLAWRAFGTELLACALAVGIAVPCIDEIIQLFVSGRNGAVRDVLIDMAGFALGTLICWLVSRAENRDRTASS